MKRIVLILLFVFILVVARVMIPNEESCLSLAFDDGYESHYFVVNSLLDERNFSATFFVFPETVNEWNGRSLMNASQIWDLSRDYEIGSHTMTHPYLNELSDSEIEFELASSKKLLSEIIGKEIEVVAFPYGRYDERVLNISRKYYLLARSLFSESDDFLISGFALENDTPVEDVCEMIDDAILEKDNLVLVFHDVTEMPSQWDTSVEDFEKILDCVESSKIKIKTFGECSLGN